MQYVGRVPARVPEVASPSGALDNVEPIQTAQSQSLDSSTKQQFTVQHNSFVYQELRNTVYTAPSCISQRADWAPQLRPSPPSLITSRVPHPPLQQEVGRQILLLVAAA
jgi:hypothetical protein